ncbi:nucleotidyltransferase domain-containing protein [Actinoplanes bogorensis]|uniref:Nucleotidyltransferase domain-containing protein n=1 Tax=Paractinoplanes bogorensis TaxID=1610840 RepID=A0ABS5YNW7_9ACTN|nr:nucleotidyltransferase domain-containing protein [Actinoplanes bogorensis]MBU2665155.1 nucleotidyltransferase domain-containing protein [Actinoplanes bogorensis]
MTGHIKIATGIAEITGARSVILHGSLAAGGFRPGHSDIDLLVVPGHPLRDDQIQDLVSLVRRESLGEATGLDLHVVTAGIARSPTRTPPLDLHIGRYVNDFEISERVPADPDLPTELSMARAGGRALLGPPPADVIGPVPAGWIVDRGRHWLRTWQQQTDDLDHLTFMTETACRIWHFAVTNSHCSKPAAVAWARERNAPDDLPQLLARVLSEIR